MTLQSVLGSGSKLPEKQSAIVSGEFSILEAFRYSNREIT